MPHACQCLRGIWTMLLQPVTFSPEVLRPLVDDRTESLATKKVCSSDDCYGLQSQVKDHGARLPWEQSCWHLRAGDEEHSTKDPAARTLRCSLDCASTTSFFLPRNVLQDGGSRGSLPLTTPATQTSTQGCPAVRTRRVAEGSQLLLSSRAAGSPALPSRQPRTCLRRHQDGC